MKIMVCQACEGMCCQTNSDTGFCPERKPFARWTEEIQEEPDAHVLVIGINTIKKIIREDKDLAKKITFIDLIRIFLKLEHQAFWIKESDIIPNDKTEAE